MQIIHTPTKKLFKKVVQEFFNRGIYLMNGSKKISEDCWDIYKEDTCIKDDDDELEIGDIDYYKEYPNTPIIPAEQFLSDIYPKEPTVYWTDKIYSYETTNGITSGTLTLAGESNKPVNKTMSVIKNIFKSKEKKALEHYGITNGDGGLTQTGREELLDYLWETNKELRKEFIKKVVEEYDKK
jgi:hypothetical protein